MYIYTCLHSRKTLRDVQIIRIIRHLLYASNISCSSTASLELSCLCHHFYLTQGGLGQFAYRISKCISMNEIISRLQAIIWINIGLLWTRGNIFLWNINQNNNNFPWMKSVWKCLLQNGSLTLPIGHVYHHYTNPNPVASRRNQQLPWWFRKCSDFIDCTE